MVTTAKDYYEILGVSKDAGADEIKKAFRRLAMKYHPDRSKGDKQANERFKEVNEAYQVLSDPEKRKQYDMMREGYNPFTGGGGFQPGGFRYKSTQRPGEPFEGFGFAFDDFTSFGGVGDIFESIFSRGGRQRGTRTQEFTQRGGDLYTEVSIPFDLAVHGGKQSFTITREEVCPRCKGTGGEPGSRVQVCPRCNGTGTVMFSQGTFGISRTCPECYGTGEKITKPCRECKGEKTVRKTRRLTVKIPPGIKEGQTIRLTGQGSPGVQGGPPGDLLIKVHIEPHPRFKRKGFDIYTEETISLEEAMLGTTRRVQTMDGWAHLKIPPGTQPMTKLRLRNAGMKRPDGTRGNQYVTIKVEIPKKMNDKQRQHFKKFVDSLK